MLVRSIAWHADATGRRAPDAWDRELAGWLAGWLHACMHASHAGSHDSFMQNLLQETRLTSCDGATGLMSTT